MKAWTDRVTCLGNTTSNRYVCMYLEFVHNKCTTMEVLNYCCLRKVEKHIGI